MGFYILWIAGCKKLIDISKWRQEWIYCGRSKLYTLLRQPEVTKKGLFSFFSDPYMMKFENLPYHENYILN